MIVLSLDIPKMNEGGVSATSDSTPFPTEKAGFALFCQDTLNFGTGRSVSLYLVQRRPILGSRTMSTGGIPGFCRRGGGGGGGGGRHNTVINPIHNFTRGRTCCEVVLHKPDAVLH